ncbi:MAG: AAA family ATPase [Treponema sp.]|jgi:predicted ABC-type ATPase|nr:AAA family ATPase [Treponema sp.]
MSNRVKRLRIFAGPNGSGKSTLYKYLTQINAFNSYYHINPDQIAKDLSISLNLDNWPINFSYNELISYLKLSPFQTMVDFNIADLLNFKDRRISLKDPTFNDSYLAAAISDFLRYKMIQSNSSFSFESVFSHDSKIKEIEIAKKANFRIYFYFITTSDPLINSQRIKNRVETGGHDVPAEKINERYFRTMNNLYTAFKLSDRAYLFDNTSEKSNNSFNLFVEKKENNIYISNSNLVPQWFDEFVLKRF